MTTNGRGLSQPPPFELRGLTANYSPHSPSRLAPMMDRLRISATMPSYSGRPPRFISQWTLSPFTVDLVEYSCAEQFMMASKACLFSDDPALSSILATDDPREYKRLRRQVRHFDHDSLLHERENIAFRGNLAKFSQDEDLQLALLRTGQRRLAEASPYDNLWGIGLRASDYRFSSPRTWRRSNLLGQTLEHVRKTLCENTPPVSDSLPADIARPLNQSGDNIFEIDLTTRTRLNTAPITEYPHTAILSAFMDSAPDDGPLDKRYTW